VEFDKLISDSKGRAVVARGEMVVKTRNIKCASILITDFVGKGMYRRRKAKRI
jgi:hypothetical protein